MSRFRFHACTNPFRGFSSPRRRGGAENTKKKLNRRFRRLAIGLTNLVQDISLCGHPRLGKEVEDENDDEDDCQILEGVSALALDRFHLTMEQLDCASLAVLLNRIRSGKEMLARTVAMLTRLIDRLDSDDSFGPKS